MSEEWRGPIATMRNRWGGRDFPHPAGRRRLLGDLPQGMDPRTPLQNSMARCRDLGPIFEMRFLNRRIVFVQGAALNAELCDESRFGKTLAPAVSNLRMFVGDGLFTAYTDEPNWALAHDLLRPAFTKPAMVTYHDTMNEVADELIDRWERADAPVDVSGDLTRLTLETIGRTSFSHSFGSFEREEQDVFVSSMIRALTHGMRRQAIMMMPWGRWVVGRADRRAQVAQSVVDDMVDGIIADRLAADDNDERDLLGLMLHSAHQDTGARLDPLAVRRNVVTFLVAGHETTSGALSFALWFLATHPQVRSRAQAEVDAVLAGEVGGIPSYAAIARLRYVRRVLDEALRLWPTAPAYARTPLRDTVIGEGSGVGSPITMTTDDWALIHLPLLHRDRSVWGEDVERFDPDRFLPEAVRRRPAHSYKPFGTGERACIGRQFALHEAVLVLARLLHHFDFEADPGYELRITERLTLMPEGFTLTPRLRTPSTVSTIDQ